MTSRARIAAALVAAACAAGALGACASGEDEGTAATPAPVAQTTPAPAPAPTQTTPAAGTTPTPTTTAPRDSEEAQSHPLPEGQRGTTAAPAPTNVKQTTADDGVSPGAPSDAEIRKELEAAEAAVTEQKKAEKETPRASGSKAELGSDGLARAPADAPEAVAHIVAGGNVIAHFPYVYGGGHGSFVDSAYDCSGSLSYALAAAGLMKQPMTSGELANSGAPGPGKWVTIYANETHTFMYVAGLRYDTSGRSGTFGSRWQTAPRSLKGFTVRHPPGL